MSKSKLLGKDFNHKLDQLEDNAPGARHHEMGIDQHMHLNYDLHLSSEAKL